MQPGKCMVCKRRFRKGANIAILNPGSNVSVWLRQAHAEPCARDFKPSRKPTIVG